MGRLIACLVLAVSLIFPTSQANADVPGGAAYKKTWILCKNENGFVDIGAAVFMKEPPGPASHVVQFRVKWLLYRTPNPTSTTIAYRRKVVESNTFPNDRRAFQWTTPKHAWRGMVAPDAGFTLVAKLTWVRAGRPDWNHRYSVVRCG